MPTKKSKVQTCLDIMGCYVVEVKLFFVGFPQLPAPISV